MQLEKPKPPSPFLPLQDARALGGRRMFTAREREKLLEIVRSTESWTRIKEGARESVSAEEVFDRIVQRRYSYAFQETARLIVCIHGFYYYELKK